MLISILDSEFLKGDGYVQWVYGSHIECLWNDIDPQGDAGAKSHSREWQMYFTLRS